MSVCLSATSSLPLFDATAFARFVEPVLPRALRAARKILGCEHLAEDAVQEALLTLHRETRPPEDLGGWLVRTVVHRSLHQRRTLLRRHRHELAAGMRRDDVCCDNPLHHARDAENEARLLAAISTLPEDQRRVVELRLDQDLDYEAIAQEIQRPVGTVRSRLHRARRALAAAFPELEQEPDTP